jgi:outer membrane immunogenic protein
MKAQFGALAIASFALAMPAAAGQDWSGSYLGIAAGASRMEAETSRVLTANNYWTIENQTAWEAASLIDLEDDGFIVGIQAGHNWGLGGVIVGLEADFNFNSHSTGASVASAYPPPDAAFTFITSTEVDQDWLATLRARAGFDLAGSFLYATGGLAVANVTLTQTLDDNSAIPFTALSADETLTGWTAGGGIEVPIAGSTTLKLEYLYVDLGTADLDGQPISSSPTTFQHGAADLTHDVIRAGMNWKIN